MFLPLGDNIQRRGLPIVPAFLIWANLMVFGYQMRLLFSDPGGWDAEYEFVQSWGLIPQQLANWNVTGLLTHMFLHADVIHLVGNMIILWAFACSLEEGMGGLTLLGFYLLFGLIGGLLQCVMDWGSEVPIVGASGAIAGLMGAYTLLYGAMSEIRTLVFLFFRPFVMQIPAVVYGGGWFLMQLLPVADSTADEGGVAWWAHIGGFLAGMAVAAICRREFERSLVVDASGELSFQDTTPQTAPVELEISGDLPLPKHCPYCSSLMEPSTRWAPNLARCGNQDCKRMIMLEPVPGIS
ncbi:MAG: rhomboid family intramembrane serine protease [bacterium]|nr:rhomboid family intramembrane serine protease [bacterium]